MRRRLLLAFILHVSLSLTATQVTAEETAEEQAPAAESAPVAEPETRESDTTQDEGSDVQPAGALRDRNLSDAFKNFQPSEEISADNAVSFPVDI